MMSVTHAVGIPRWTPGWNPVTRYPVAPRTTCRMAGGTGRTTNSSVPAMRQACQTTAHSEAPRVTPICRPAGLATGDSLRGGEPAQLLSVLDQPLRSVHLATPGKEP